MAKRISALHQHYRRGKIRDGAAAVGVTLREVPNLTLWQIAAWHDTLSQIGAPLARGVGVTAAPKPCESALNPQTGAALLRVEALKWWLIGAEPPALSPELGAVLDISHSRTRIRVQGADAAALLNRHLSLDLRPHAFPQGAVASTLFHHVGVTLWHAAEGYELFIPRGFALSLWEVLLQSAAQFGGEVGE